MSVDTTATLGPKPGDAETLPIIEIFGPVIQGEGAMIGKQTHFIRLGGCDYRCSWCDTPYAVLPEKVRQNRSMLTVPAVVAKVTALGVATPWVTLSGGNPALHQLGPLAAGLRDAGFMVAVETQGTLYRDWLRDCDLVTLSPKPPSSGMDQSIEALDQFVNLPEANLKVVVFDEADFTFARSVHLRYPTVPFYLQVGNEVGNDTTETLLERLDWLARRTMADPAMGAAVVLPQLHVLLYGNRRGV
jgi:7-carboxy-7-deazaguanine synthase